MFSIFSKKNSKQDDSEKDETPQNYDQFCVESDLGGEFVVLDKHIDANPNYSAPKVLTIDDYDNDDSETATIQKMYTDRLDEVSDNLRAELASQYNGKKPEKLTPAEVGRIQIKASRAAKATTDALEGKMKREERQKALEPKSFTSGVGEH
jgi:hypothetical protein